MGTEPWPASGGIRLRQMRLRGRERSGVRPGAAPTSAASAPVLSAETNQRSSNSSLSLEAAPAKASEGQPGRLARPPEGPSFSGGWSAQRRPPPRPTSDSGGWTWGTCRSTGPGSEPGRMSGLVKRVSSVSLCGSFLGAAWALAGSRPLPRAAGTPGLTVDFLTPADGKVE